MIGGTSWESTVTYYQVINRTVKERLGGLHSAKCVIYSVDFDELAALMARGEWEQASVVLIHAAKTLETAETDLIILCSNTLHKMASAVQAAITVPLLHIAELTADELEQRSIVRAGLLGTRYTMEQDFYKERLVSRGMDVLVPDAKDRERLNAIIFDELCVGKVLPESKAFVLEVVDKLSASGAEGVILGCTEIGLLLQQGDTGCPLFDTALIHAGRTARYALRSE